MQLETVAKIQILVLEDDPDLQAPLPAMLEQQHGFSVTATTTPFGEAGSTAKRLRPDVTVVADVGGDPLAGGEEPEGGVPGMSIGGLLFPQAPGLGPGRILGGA